MCSSDLLLEAIWLTNQLKGLSAFPGVAVRNKTKLISLKVPLSVFPELIEQGFSA